MARRDGIEFLVVQRKGSKSARLWFEPCTLGALRLGLPTIESAAYNGSWEWLTLFGIGTPKHSAACEQHTAKGRPVACWDLGYIGRNAAPDLNYVRVSLNAAHPSIEHLDKTSSNPSRWNRFHLPLRNEYDPEGRVVVVGMGQKSRAYLREENWERRKLEEMAQRFPHRRIVYRPKLNRHQEHDGVEWPDRSEHEPIGDLLRGASLVVCRHSNVAVDACIAGVPVECEAGAAHWLYRRGSNPGVVDRLDFLARLCWWQWQTNEAEMEAAWKFLRRAFESTSAPGATSSTVGSIAM